MSTVIAKFEGLAASGFHTLDCELVEEGDNIHLEYVIVAPFTSRGERRRQTWCWSTDYPKDRLLREARAEADKLSSAMWGE
jgi:hypothetical protein